MSDEGSDDLLDMRVWCNLCSEQHLPCETNSDGADVGISDCFCGCCGRVIDDNTSTSRKARAIRRRVRRGMEPIWCLECEDHVLPTPHPWEGTYFAQFHKDCPYQEAP